MAKKSSSDAPEGRRTGAAPSVDRRRRALRDWLITGGVVLCVALVAFGFWDTSQSSTCASCHTEQAERLAGSQHATLSCYDCHLDSPWSYLEQKNEEFLRMYPRAVSGVTLDGPGRRVSREACSRCHGNGPYGTHEGKGLRVSHDDCAPIPTLCDTCHGTIAHGDAVRWSRTAVMDDCLACHQTVNAPVKCETCHAGKLGRERLTSGPWQVTHGAQWRDTHGMGNLATCATCHPDAKCIKCHKTEIPHQEGFFNTHGKQALVKDAKCLDCHTNKSWCTSCHGSEMPHPRGFLKVHSDSAKSYTDPLCLRCHAPEDCKNCHEAHTHPGMTEGLLGGAVETTGGGN